MITKNSIKRLFRTLQQRAFSPLSPIKGKVIFTSTALDLTGAQRQLANAALEIKKNLKAPMKIIFIGEPNPQAIHLQQTLHQHHIETQILGFPPIHLPEQLYVLEEPLWSLSKLDQSMLFGFYEAFLKEKPEIVHAWGMATGALTAVAALLAGVPKIILGWRGMSPLHKPSVSNLSFNHHVEVFKHLLEFPHIKFTANSEIARQDHAKWIGCKTEKIHLITNGLNVEFLESFPLENLRSQFKIPPKKKLIGGMFRFHEDKYPELWIETAKVLLSQRKDLAFVLAGTGDLLPKVQAMIKESQLEEYFFLLGQYKNVKSFYESLDCFLLTSRPEGEGLPNVLLEAQYFGVPTVTTPGGGAEETLHSATGILCNTLDPYHLAEAVQKALANPSQGENTRLIYRQFLKENFSLEEMGKKFVTLYHSVEKEPINTSLAAPLCELA